MNIVFKGCAVGNYEQGRRGKTINKVILHWFGIGTLESANARFQKVGEQASAHYGISGGRIWQWVKEEDTSYGAGNLAANLEGINIEHDATVPTESDPGHNASEETIQNSITLVTEICRKYNIPADSNHIYRHSFFKATQCPGTLQVERIIEEVAKNLLPPPPVITDQTKIPQIIDEGGNVMEVQAIRSKLAELNQRVKSSEGQLTGFIEKWFTEWQLKDDPNKSHQVILEEDMGKHLALEDELNKYIDAIEALVGSFDKPEPRLAALAAAASDKEALVKERDGLLKKLEEAKTPVGYKFIKSWDLYSLRFKLYKKNGG